MKTAPRTSLVALLAALLAVGCGGNGGSGGGDGGSGDRDSVGAAVPASPAQATFALAGMVQDTFTVLATWEPVEFLGDTVSEYRRHLVRTDTSGLDLQDTLSAVGSETLEVVGPSAGQTATYDYCLWSRALNEAGEVVESESPTCASFQYTSPTSFPPPPDSLEVNPQQALAVDSLDVVPDSLRMAFDVDAAGDTTWLYTLAWHEGVLIDSVAGNTYPMRAEVYKDGEIVGCAGACDGVVIQPATWDEGVPVVMVGRPAYPAGEEWMADRLPWLRQLTG